MGIGLVIGVLLIWIGYIVRTKKEFSFLAGLGAIWEPINREKLGNRIGILFIIIGLLAILTSIFTVWLGPVVEKVSGILVIICIVMIIIAIVLDKIGY